MQESPQDMMGGPAISKKKVQAACHSLSHAGPGLCIVTCSTWRCKSQSCCRMFSGTRGVGFCTACAASVATPGGACLFNIAFIMAMADLAQNRGDLHKHAQ